MGLPPRDVFAAATRHAVETLHTDWDGPHAFQTLHWDGEKLHTGLCAFLLADIDPDTYPAVMAGFAREQQDKHPGDPAYAYLLQGEFFGATEPGPDATKDEIVQYNIDRVSRTFHQRPDGEEACIAWCADIHGRMWSAVKLRTQPDRIQEHFHPPGSKVRGQLVRALLAVAQTQGVLAYGKPSLAGAWLN